jgi:dTDP-4-dehydrorhamnose 3,5-epimerase
VRFTRTALPDVVVIDVEPANDERGFFARTYSREEFEEQGLDAAVEQTSLSFNLRARTLRGLHYQKGAAAESKLVRCTRGRVFDVAVDIRPDSATYLRWVGVELSADNRRALFVPRGHAHGFLTLTSETELLYQISAPYQPDAAAGLRWDDPAIGIAWPATPLVISQRDAAYELLRP